MSIHVELTNPTLSRVYRDDKSGELVLEFRHHSDTVILVWFVDTTKDRSAARLELSRIADVGTSVLDGPGGEQWTTPPKPARRRRPSRALDRAGLTESGPRPIT